MQTVNLLHNAHPLSPPTPFLSQVFSAVFGLCVIGWTYTGTIPHHHTVVWHCKEQMVLLPLKLFVHNLDISMQWSFTSSLVGDVFKHQSTVAQDRTCWNVRVERSDLFFRAGIEESLCLEQLSVTQCKVMAEAGNILVYVCWCTAWIWLSSMCKLVAFFSVPDRHQFWIRSFLDITLWMTWWTRQKLYC